MMVSNEYDTQPGDAGSEEFFSDGPWANAWQPVWEGRMQSVLPGSSPYDPSAAPFEPAAGPATSERTDIA